MDKYESIKLDNQVCFSLYASSREIIKLYKPFLDKFNLTYTQYVAMLVLWEDEKSTVKDIGKRLHLDSGTLTPLLKKIESMGLVKRYRDVNDDRVVIVELTQQGRLLKDEVTDVPREMACKINMSKEDLIALKSRLDDLLKLIEWYNITKNYNGVGYMIQISYSLNLLTHKALEEFLMKDIISKLEGNEFFKNLSYDEIKKIVSNIEYSLKNYNKGEIIANEEDKCTSLGFVLDGIIEIQRIYVSGKQITLKRLSNGEVFGEALIFSKKSSYPSTVVAASDCNVFYISKENILKLCTMDERVLGNFMSSLSNKILMLNSKIKSIAFKSIKHKVINFILEQAKMQESKTIKLKESKEEIASAMGIPRPSLSRELMNLRDSKYIKFDRNIIEILNIEELEEELFD